MYIYLYLCGMKEEKDIFQDLDGEFEFPEFDIEGIEFEGDDLTMFGSEIDDDGFNTRYIKPPRHKGFAPKRVRYRFAQDLAKDAPCEAGMFMICLIDGSFIAGDFIEAYIKQHNLHVKKLSISTLSLSQENIDSLGNLLFDGWADKLDLIVSDGFFAHYRNDLVKYMYDELDVDNRFQLATARVHTKVVLIDTHCGKKIVIRGSANLRSSACIETLEIEENSLIFDFFEAFHDGIIEKYQTINKDAKSKLSRRSLSKSQAWQSQKEQKAESADQERPIPIGQQRQDDDAGKPDKIL